MSRIGKLPIPVPDGVAVALETGNRLSVTGSLGTLQRTFAPSMLINVETGTITVDRPSNARIHRSLHGLTRTLVANMVQGVSGGFTRDLGPVGEGSQSRTRGRKSCTGARSSAARRASPGRPARRSNQTDKQ